MQCRSITAADPTGLGGRYRTGNTITVVFSESTNRGGFGGVGETNAVMTKANVDNTFSFTNSLGNGYTGQWTSRTTLVITITDDSNSGPPVPSTFKLTVVVSGNIRNYPPQCAETSATSGVLLGNFGLSLITISSWGNFGSSPITISSWVASAPAGITTCGGFASGSPVLIREHV
ncbi:hypothetical protein T484DRAFT_1776697 [Baffinella frigidus]|nr:hypothetical protein T484DRAFT_1776697 [Cryptophyta sp. CCMP2293]